MQTTPVFPFERFPPAFYLGLVGLVILLKDGFSPFSASTKSREAAKRQVNTERGDVSASGTVENQLQTTHAR